MENIFATIEAAIKKIFDLIAKLMQIFEQPKEGEDGGEQA